MLSSSTRRAAAAWCATLWLTLCAASAQAATPSMPVFGWVEWAYIEPLHIHVKAKLDSGAKTSSLSAVDMERFTRDGDAWIRFHVPISASDGGTDAPQLIEMESRLEDGPVDHEDEHAVDPHAPLRRLERDLHVHVPESRGLDPRPRRDVPPPVVPCLRLRRSLKPAADPRREGPWPEEPRGGGRARGLVPPRDRGWAPARPRRGRVQARPPKGPDRRSRKAAAPAFSSPRFRRSASPSSSRSRGRSAALEERPVRDPVIAKAQGDGSPVLQAGRVRPRYRLRRRHWRAATAFAHATKVRPGSAPRREGRATPPPGLRS